MALLLYGCWNLSVWKKTFFSNGSEAYKKKKKQYLAGFIIAKIGFWKCHAYFKIQLFYSYHSSFSL